MIGFSVVVVGASASRLLSGSALVSAAVLGVAVLVAAAWLVAEGIRSPGRGATLAAVRLSAPAVLIAFALAWLPFAASGHIGTLGAGINHDLAAHLNWAAWLADPGGSEPWGVEIGYPIGTHSTVASLIAGFGLDPLAAMLGLIVALPMLGAVLSMAVLAEARAGVRAIGGALVAMPYLLAGAFAIGSFKEIEMGLLLLAFAITLQGLGGRLPRRLVLVSLPVLIAGMLATYSYAGLGWAIGTLAVWALLELWRVWRTEGSATVRSLATGYLPTVVGATALAVAISLVELVRAWNLMTASEVSISSAARLASGIPIPEVFGVWPGADFLGGLDSPIAWLVFGGFGLAVLLIGTRLAWSRGQLALVAALGASAVILFGSELFGSFYTQAKALSVPAALVMALSAYGLASDRLSNPGGRALAAVFFAVALYSSFLVLRQTNVAPPDRRSELEVLRQRIDAAGVLAVTSDRFAAFSLRGGLVASPASFSETVVRSRAGKFGEYPVDYDSARFGVSDAWDYLLITNASYQSRPSSDYSLVKSTPSFELWKRTGGPRPTERVVLSEGIEMGARLRCSDQATRKLLESLSRRGNLQAHTVATPVLGDRKAWSPRANPAEGEAVFQSLRLPRGRWDLSLQYFSPVLDLRVTGPGLDRRLPPDAFGRLRASGQLSGFESPFWSAGEISSRGGRYRITATARELNWFQKLIGVDRRADLGTLAAVRSGTEQVLPAFEACGRYVDYLSFDPPPGRSLANPALQVPSASERARFGKRSFEVSDGTSP